MQPSVPVALSRKKAPRFATRGLIEMERAKRLELLRSILQMCLGEAAYGKLTQSSAAGAAHVRSVSFLTTKMQVWAEELEEIVRAWPTIADGVHHGMIEIVRAQRSGSSRPSTGPKFLSAH
jgi:hypothetical protein